MPNTPVDPPPPTAGWISIGASALRAVCWVGSAALLAFVFACYGWRFDSCAFVTLFPPWCWALGGVGLAWLSHAKRHRWRSGVLVALWLAFLLLAADSPASFWRALWPAAEGAGAIRVVSLNCAGNSSAARDVERLKPDIILFQESPTAQTLTELAARLYGSDVNLVRG